MTGPKTASRLHKGFTMSKISFASHPFLLGFEQLDRLVERTAKTGNEGYPPYNIEQSSESSYRITLAVAGFREEDLSITLENSQLVIRGRQVDDLDGRVFVRFALTSFFTHGTRNSFQMAGSACHIMER